MGNTCYNNNAQSSNLAPVQIIFKKNNQFQEDQSHNTSNRKQFNPELEDQQKHKIHLSKNNKSKYHQSISVQNLKKQLQQHFNKCKKCYQQHYIDQAFQQTTEIHKLLQLVKSKNLSYRLTQQQNKLLQKVKVQYQDVVYYQNEIQKGNWELKSHKNGIKISCRREPDGTVGCRIQAFSDIPFEILISVMIQMDYYKDYTPFLEISREEKEVARNCRIGYTLNHIPFFTKRESFFQGVGYSRLNHKSKQLFLYTRSIHDKKNLQELLQFPVNVNQQYIQLDYKYFVVRYRPIKQNLGWLDIGMNVDVKMGFIPTWLMEKVSKDFGQNFFKNIMKISKNFKGSKWQKNVENNPHLFLYFQKEVKNYLQKQKVE